MLQSLGGATQNERVARVTFRGAEWILRDRGQDLLLTITRRSKVQDEPLKLLQFEIAKEELSRRGFKVDTLEAALREIHDRGVHRFASGITIAGKASNILATGNLPSLGKYRASLGGVVHTLGEAGVGQILAKIELGKNAPKNRELPQREILPSSNQTKSASIPEVSPRPIEAADFSVTNSGPPQTTPAAAHILAELTWGELSGLVLKKALQSSRNCIPSTVNRLLSWATPRVTKIAALCGVLMSISNDATAPETTGSEAALPPPPKITHIEVGKVVGNQDIAAAERPSNADVLGLQGLVVPIRSDLIQLESAPIVATNHTSESPTDTASPSSPLIEFSNSSLFEDRATSSSTAISAEASPLKSTEVSGNVTVAASSSGDVQATTLTKVENLSFSGGFVRENGEDLLFGNLSLLPAPSSQGGLEARIGARWTKVGTVEETKPTFSIDLRGTTSAAAATIQWGVSLNNESEVERIVREVSGGSPNLNAGAGADLLSTLSMPIRAQGSLYQEFRFEEKVRLGFEDGIERAMAKAELVNKIALIGKPKVPEDLFLVAKTGVLADYEEDELDSKTYFQLGVEGRYRKFRYDLAAQTAVSTKGKLEGEIKGKVEYAPSRSSRLFLEAFVGRTGIDRETLGDLSNANAGVRFGFQRRF